MTMLMIKCPKTQKPLPTGIGMDKKSFETASLSTNTIAPCPHCGGAHTWDKKDVLPFT
jgi:endogenous inhibitor of DNA gyrase (YacG/DUF329 family)